ncbi:UNVERIFIED_CONTAM: hypothetical protein FKN15_034868 [Acipenser sinensis]
MEECFAVALPETPANCPVTKKKRLNTEDESVSENNPKSTISNADNLKAVNSLSTQFTGVEKEIKQNSLSSTSKSIDFVCEEIKTLGVKVKETITRVSVMEKRVAVVQEKCEDLERQGRRSAALLFPRKGK